MALVTLEEAKTYLRVDDPFEDTLIGTILASAVRLCIDVARLTNEEWEAVNTGEDPDLTSVRETMKVAILYTAAYLYEHREKADHHELALTLRSLLFAIREGVV